MANQLLLLLAVVASAHGICDQDFSLDIDNFRPFNFQPIRFVDRFYDPINDFLYSGRGLQNVRLTDQPFNDVPRTIQNNCRCTKTIVRPQEIQQLIKIPVTRQYIQTLNDPVVENINYCATPINCPACEYSGRNEKLCTRL